MRKTNNRGIANVATNSEVSIEHAYLLMWMIDLVSVHIKVSRQKDLRHQQNMPIY